MARTSRKPLFTNVFIKGANGGSLSARDYNGHTLIAEKFSWLGCITPLPTSFTDTPRGEDQSIVMRSYSRSAIEACGHIVTEFHSDKFIEVS